MPFCRSSFQLLLPTLLAGAAACGGDKLVLPGSGTPSTITVVKGAGQTGTVGARLPDSLVVRVQDVRGRAIKGQQVVYTVESGAGTVSPGSALTDAGGLAAVAWTLGPAAGAQQVTARPVGNGAPSTLVATFNATATAATAAQLSAVSGTGQTATAGTRLPDSLIVRVVDGSSNPVPAVTVSWSVGSGGALSAPTTQTGSDGRTGVAWTLGPAAGAQTARATVSGLTGSPVAFTATATVGSAGKLTLVQPPSGSVGAGQVFPQQPAVQVQDQFGNNVTDAGRAVIARISSGPAGAVLAGDSIEVTSATGLATYTALAINGPAGTYVINFSGVNVSGAQSGPITVTAGQAARLAFTVQPSNTVAGTAIAPAVQVAVQDAFGQTVAGATNQVTLAIGANPGSGTLSGTAAVAATNGVATFSGLSISSAGAGYTLVATSPGLTQATSSAFTVNAGSASGMTANSPVTLTGTAGAAVTPAPSVKVTDPSNNPVVRVAVTFGVTGGGGTVSGGSATTNSAGVATVGSWTLGATAGANTLTASSPGLPDVVFTATGTAGTAGKLAMVTQPSTTAASGVAFAQQPKVQLEDPNSNPVGTAGLAVTASIASGPAGATLGGTATVATASDGSATFSGLRITGPAGSYTLSFTATNVSGVQSNSITLTAGNPAALAFIAQPTSATAGAAISPAVQVEVRDAAGNRVTTAATPVTLTIADNPGGGALAGGGPVSAASGVATFSSLSVNRSGTGYTLRAGASGLRPDTSNAFNILTGPASTVAANSPVSYTATVGTAVSPAPSVKVSDASGNGVPGVQVTFAVAQGGGSISGAVQNTDASGIATVGSWTLGSVAGSSNNVLTATAPGLTGSPVTFTATATAGSAGQLTIATQPSASATTGQALATQPQIQLRDGSGNVVPQAGVLVQAAIASGPGGSLSNATALTNGSGLATFSGLTITGPGGNYSLGFTVPASPGISGVTSNNITLQAGTATKLVLTTVPPGSVQSGVAFGPVAVQLEDASGNPVSPSGVTVKASVSGGRALGGTTQIQTDGTGQASFSSLAISGPVGSVTLTFSAPLLTSAQSAPITVTPGPVSAAMSGISAAPTAITAGDAGTTVTVTAKDASGNPIPGASVTPTSTGGGSFAGSPGTTNASGQAVFTFTSTTAGSPVLGAVIASTTINQTVGVTVSPGAPDAAASSVTVNPTSITSSSGSSAGTVTVTVRDQFNNAVGGQSVTLGVTGSGNAIAPSLTQTTNGAGQATYTVSSTQTGVKTITATVGAVTLAQQPTLTVNPGPPAAPQSLVSASPSSVAAGTSVTLTVTAEDQFGNPIGGATVGLSSDLQGPIGSVSTGVSGQATTSYTATAAGTQTITAAITATSGSLNVTTTVTVTPGPPDATASSVTVNPTSITASNGSSSATVTVTVRDQFSNPLGGQSVTLGVTGSGNAITPSLTQTTNGAGQATYTVSSTQTGVKTVTAMVGAVTLAQQPTLTVTPGGVSAATSQISALPTTITAGDAGTTVTVTAKDAGGNPIQGASVTPTSTNGGTFSNSPGTTDGSGQATFTFTTTAAGATTLGAVIAATTINQTVVVTVNPAAPDAAASSVTVNPTSITASSGGSVATVTVTIRDQFNNPVGGQSVTLGVTGSGNTIAPSLTQTTDGAGQATYTVSSTQSGVKTVTATVGAVTLAQQPALTVNPDVVDATQSTATADTPVAVSTNSVVTITLKDQFGNPISGVTPTLVNPSGGTPVNPTSPTDVNGITTGGFSAGAPGTYTLQVDANAVTFPATPVSIVVQ